MTLRMSLLSASKAIIILFALGATLMAQTPLAAPAGPEKAPKLLPGLDKELIDATADPCVDFFQYSCGNFPKLYPIPNDRSSYGTGAIIGEYTEYTLHAMLVKAAAGVAGTRLLFPHRRCAGKDPQAVCRAHHQYAEAAG